MTEQAPYRQRGQDGRKCLRIASEVLFVAMIALNWLATQYAATTMLYAPFLNGRIVAHVYQPFAWFWWQHYWPNNGLRIGNHIIWLAPMWRFCEHLAMYPMLALGGIALVTAVVLMQPHQAADLHGSASWASTEEIEQAGLL